MMPILRRPRPDPTARLAELHARVHPPTGKPVEVDVAAVVRAEIDRRHAVEIEERRRAEAARFAGGPCWACGVATAIAIEDDGTLTPDWHTSPRGQMCGWCVDWRSDGTDDELLDRVAAILRDEGSESLSIVHRLGFNIEPGLASELGVVAWVDSGGPPGVRWGHLSSVRPPTPVTLPGRTFGDFLTDLPQLMSRVRITELTEQREAARRQLAEFEAKHEEFGTSRTAIWLTDAQAELDHIERELALYAEATT